MGEAGVRRRRLEPSLDEQFESLFDPSGGRVRLAARKPAGGVLSAAKAALALFLGIAAAILFLVAAAIVFAFKPR